MQQTYFEEMSKIISASTEGRAQIASGFAILIKGFEEQKKIFNEQKEKVNDDINRGAKLTKHKLSI